MYTIVIKRTGKQYMASIMNGVEIVWTSEARKNRKDVWKTAINTIKKMHGAKIDDQTGLKLPPGINAAEYAK